MKKWSHTFLTNGIILASGLVSGVLAARLLGVEERGLLAAIIYWPHFLTGVAAMGLNEAIAIRIAKSGTTDTLIATVLLLSLVLAVPLIVAAWWLLPLLLGQSRQAYFLFAQIYLTIFLPTSYVAMNLLAIDQGELKFHRFNIQRILQAVAYPLLLVLLWIVGYLTVESAAIAVVTGTVIVALIRLSQVWSALKNWPSIKEATELIVQGARLHATNLVMFLSMQIDKIALILFSNDMKLGLYVVAITAASAAQSLFVQTYINITLPTAAKLGASPEHIAGLLVPLRNLFVLIVLFTVMMILIMPFVLPIIFGNEFIPSVQYAQWLAVVFAFVGLKNVLIYLFRAWSKNKPGLIGEGLTSIILILGAYPALARGDIMGLILLMLFSHCLGALLLLFFLGKITNLSAYRLFDFSHLK